MNQPGTDPVVEWLNKNNLPVTRENYIDVNWMGSPPDPWTQEDEESLPESLRRPANAI